MPRMIRCVVLAAMTFACCTLLVGADEKTPVPSADAQKQAEKVIRDVFKADYARAKLPADKAALAEKLLAQGIDTKDDPAARFVLFREARDLAAEAGAMPTCFKAIDAMAGSYGVDVLAMKTETLTLAAKSAPVASRKAVAETALTMTDDAVAADNYDAATRLATTALTAAKSGTNTALTQQATLRVKAVEEVRVASESVKAARAVLKDKPTDAEANSAVGKFLCLMKGEWDKGVPMLALGKDPELKRLAELELAKPSDAKDKAGVGDGWWDLADKAPAGTAKTQLQRRAGHWYRQAVPELTGLSKAKVEKRITELEELQNQALGRFRQIWVGEDAFKGSLKLEVLSIEGTEFTGNYYVLNKDGTARHQAKLNGKIEKGIIAFKTDNIIKQGADIIPFAYSGKITNNRIEGLSHSLNGAHKNISFYFILQK